jgi:hypothetical protein
MDIFSAIFRHGTRLARPALISAAWVRATTGDVGKPGELGFFTGRGSSDAGASRAGATLHVDDFMPRSDPEQRRSAEEP